MRSLLLLFFILLSFFANAQAPNWLWVKPAPAYTGGHNAIAIDTKGNTYATGHFFDSLQLGPFLLQRPYDRQNIYSTYIAKYDVAGNVMWARVVGPNRPQVNELIIDGKDNVYISGIYNQSYNKDSICGIPVEYEGFYVAKFNTSGDIMAVKIFDSLSVAYGGTGIQLCYDGNNNIYISAFCGKGRVFDGNTLPLPGIIIAKYDDQLQIQWIKPMPSVEGLVIHDLVAEPTGLYIGGSFEDTLTIDTSVLIGPQFASTTFIARYDADANPLWARATSVANGITTQLWTTTTGDLVMTGLLTGWSFGIIPNPPSNGFFVAKYLKDGTLSWAKQVGYNNLNNIGVTAITTDYKDNIYLTGGWHDTASLQSISLITPKNRLRGFVAKLSAIGDVQWAKTLYASNSDYFGIPAIKADLLGNVYVGGLFSDSLFMDGLVTNSGNAIWPFLGKLSSTTGIENLTAEIKDLQLYPNPANSKVAISSGEAFTKAEVFDMSGRMVYTHDYMEEHKEVELSLTNLPAGLYMLQVTGKQKQSGRLVIVK